MSVPSVKLRLNTRSATRARTSATYSQNSDEEQRETSIADKQRSRKQRAHSTSQARLSTHLRQNARVQRTRSGKISRRPRIIASAQIQLWKSVRLA